MAHSRTSSVIFFCSAPDPTDADDSVKLAMNNDNNEYSQKLCTLRVQFWSLGWLWNLGGGTGRYLSLHQLLTSIPPQPHLENTQENLKRMVSTLFRLCTYN